jgi:hypothetical protein
MLERDAHPAPAAAAAHAPAAHRPSFASVVSQAAAPAASKPRAGPPPPPAARDVATEQVRVRDHAAAFAARWEPGAAHALAEKCALAVRRGASADDVARRLRQGYCLFDECRMSDCQRCRAGRSASDLPPPRL